MPVRRRAVGSAVRERCDSGGSRKAYAYNPTSNKWNAKAAPSACGGAAAKVFLDGKARMLFISGATADAPDYNGSQLYTP